MKLEIPHVTICSVEPVERRLWKTITAPTEDQPHMGNNRIEYVLKAADKKNGWSILKVFDGVQFPAQYNLGEGADKPASPPIQVRARDIANWLVEQWQETSLLLKFPRGIKIIGDDIPTAEELRELNQMSTQRMRAMVQMVDLAVNAGKPLDFVTKEYIDAANALGEVREWARADRRQKKACPNCRGVIDADALGCTHCGINLVNYYEEEFYTVDEIRAMDPAVADAAAAKIARKTRKAPVPKG